MARVIGRWPGQLGRWAHHPRMTLAVKTVYEIDGRDSSTSKSSPMTLLAI